MKQRRGIRKIVILASIFLLLGAIVNIGVAWTLGLTSVQLRIHRKGAPDQEAIDWWRSNAPEGFAGAPGSMQEARRVGICWQGLTETQEFTTDTHYVAGRFDFGWPVAALEWSTWTNLKSRTHEERDLIRISGWPLPAGTTPALALRPLGLGFTVNTVLYATILWLLFALVGALRRMRRIRRGLCPACAYPIGTSELCTECGKPVRASTT